MARTVDNARWKGKYTDPIGLARLCETYEDFTLNKGKITRSNWEAILRDAQLECTCQWVVLATHLHNFLYDTQMQQTTAIPV